MRAARCLALSLVATLAASSFVTVAADESGWITLSDSLDGPQWRQPTGLWYVAGDAKLNPENDRQLVGSDGKGVLINGKLGRTVNLYTSQSFGDCEFHCEFLVSSRSNSGIKLHGLYEIQIADSYGKATAQAMDNGGIYPRAELLPKYRYLDEGYPPKVNASKPPGEWQTLDITFQAPRFDADGKKTANARFVKVVLNGQTIHENQEIPCPTGHAWTRPEKATAPIMLQADHGPVAFRNVKVRPIQP
jgi:hypothetical protein